MLKPGKVLISELEKVFWGGPFEISDDSKIQVDRTAKVVEDVINGCLARSSWNHLFDDTLAICGRNF